MNPERTLLFIMRHISYYRNPNRIIHEYWAHKRVVHIGALPVISEQEIAEHPADAFTLLAALEGFDSVEQMENGGESGHMKESGGRAQVSKGVRRVCESRTRRRRTAPAVESYPPLNFSCNRGVIFLWFWGFIGGTHGRGSWIPEKKGDRGFVGEAGGEKKADARRGGGGGSGDRRGA